MNINKKYCFHRKNAFNCSKLLLLKILSQKHFLTFYINLFKSVASTLRTCYMIKYRMKNRYIFYKSESK